MTLIYNRPDRTDCRRELRQKQTPAEALIWSYLRAGRFNDYKFRRQYGIDNFIVDFYCPHAKLVIEIDGDSHFDPKALAYDQMRSEIIEKLGIKIIRFTNQQVQQNIEDVLKSIEAILPASA